MLRFLYGLKRWIYRGDRPGVVVRPLNRYWRWKYGSAHGRAGGVTLRVRGRSSGRTIAFPVMLVSADGHWYVVSMLGAHANWVRNVRAAGGKAAIRRGRTFDVRLRELPVERRAPILKKYLHAAPGARPHIPVDPEAPIGRFEEIAADHPVFEVTGLPTP
ncbi:nitroreductase/quinone reductase family protein [Streptomyces sp. NPDC050703]|uniref:nitroreductase/quinone reductase family protein n=1 Tax=Streptomyces sp. NPDC050703 TaxID=3157218 RepID=UPI00341CE974